MTHAGVPGDGLARPTALGAAAEADKIRVALRVVEHEVREVPVRRRGILPHVGCIDVADETFLWVPPSRVAAAFADPRRWREYWPDLTCRVYADRGAEGLRWRVGGALIGTMEVWLEPALEGTLLHYFLRADPARPLGGRRLRREVRRRQLAAKHLSLRLKRELEGQREAGVPPA
jgi:hypothetical protein